MVSEVLLSSPSSFSLVQSFHPALPSGLPLWGPLPQGRPAPAPGELRLWLPFPRLSDQPWASFPALALAPCGPSERLASSPAATPHFCFSFFFPSFPELTRSRCGARWLERWGEEGGGRTASQTGGKGGEPAGRRRPGPAPRPLSCLRTATGAKPCHPQDPVIRERGQGDQKRASWDEGAEAQDTTSEPQLLRGAGTRGQRGHRKQTPSEVKRRAEGTEQGRTGAEEERGGERGQARQSRRRRVDRGCRQEAGTDRTGSRCPVEQQHPWGRQRSQWLGGMSL